MSLTGWDIFRRTSSVHFSFFITSFIKTLSFVCRLFFLIRQMGSWCLFGEFITKLSELLFLGVQDINKLKAGKCQSWPTLKEIVKRRSRAYLSIDFRFKLCFLTANFLTLYQTFFGLLLQSIKWLGSPDNFLLFMSYESLSKGTELIEEPYSYKKRHV